MRYSQLWAEEKQRVAALEKEIEQMKFQILLANSFINDGHQQEFANWVSIRMLGHSIAASEAPTDTGSVT